MKDFKFQLDNFNFNNYYNLNNVNNYNENNDSKFNFFDEFSNKFLVQKELNSFEFLDIYNNMENVRNTLTTTEQILFNSDINSFSVTNNGANYNRDRNNYNRTTYSKPTYRSNSRYTVSNANSRNTNRKKSEQVKKSKKHLTNKAKSVLGVTITVAGLIGWVAFKNDSNQVTVTDLDNTTHTMNISDLNTLETKSPTVIFKDVNGTEIKGDLHCLLRNSKNSDNGIFQKMAVLIPILKGKTDLGINGFDYDNAVKKAINNFPEFEEATMNHILNDNYGKAFNDSIGKKDSIFELDTKSIKSSEKNTIEFESKITEQGDPENTISNIALPSELKNTISDINIAYSSYYKLQELSKKENLTDEDKIIKQKCEKTIINSINTINDYSFSLENSEIEKNIVGYDVKTKNLDDIIKNTTKELFDLNIKQDINEPMIHDEVDYDIKDNRTKEEIKKDQAVEKAIERAREQQWQEQEQEDRKHAIWENELDR